MSDRIDKNQNEHQTNCDLDLSCDFECHACVSACPNQANIEIHTGNPDFAPPIISFGEDGRVLMSPAGRVFTSREYCVVNIGDNCDECEACTASCASGITPYKGRPRVYLDADSFAKDQASYYLGARGGNPCLIYGQGRESEMIWFAEGGFIYENAFLSAKFDPETFEVRVLSILAGSKASFPFNAKNAAIMAILLTGLKQYYPSKIQEDKS